MVPNIPVGLLGLAAGLGQAGRTSPVPLGFGEAFGGALMKGLQAYSALSGQEQQQQLRRLEQLETLRTLETLPPEDRPFAILAPKAYAKGVMEARAKRAEPDYGKQVVGGALLDITGETPKVLYEYQRDKGAGRKDGISEATRKRWERENAAIRNARMALAQFPGGAGELRKALSQYIQDPLSPDGRARVPNPDYNPQLAAIWKQASQRLYGVERDPEHLALQSWIIGRADNPFPLRTEAQPAQRAAEEPLPIDPASSKPDFASMEVGRIYTLPQPLQLRDGRVIPAGTKLRWDGKTLVPAQ